MSKPLILLTNDDGFHAPGIRAMAVALEELGTVAVVAPSAEQSGCGRKITLHKPLRAIPRGDQKWAVDGTPTDCIYLGIFELLGRRPDLVVSGINRGPNLADDVLYSGTVAGAMEGASVGVPSFAISLEVGKPFDYAPAAQFGVRVARFVLGQVWPNGVLLNVNVPDTNGTPVGRFRWTHGGRRDYAQCVTRRNDPRGRPYYWLGTGRLGHHPNPGSDCDTIERGCATITPLKLNLTDEEMLQSLQSTGLDGCILDPDT